MSWLLADLPKGSTIPREENWTKGPEASLGEIVGSAFEEQYRTLSVFGIQAEFMDRINAAKPLEEGVALPKFTADEAKAIAQHLEDGTPLSEDPFGPYATPAARGAPNLERLQGPEAYRGSTKARFDKFQELTGGQMTAVWADTRKSVRDILDRSADVRSRSGFVSGILGGFAGAVAGSFTPRDPLNVASIFVGGFGAKAVQRIGTEIGLNSGIEAINMLTGVADNRRLAGVPLTQDEVIGNIAMTGLGAGVLRGAFVEAPSALLRRLARDVPQNPPPAAPARPDAPPPEGRGLTGRFTTPEGVEGEFTPTLRGSISTPEERISAGSTATTADRLRVNYMLDYLEDARTPPLARGAVTADFGYRMATVDQLIAQNAFGRADRTLSEVLQAVSVRDAGGQEVYPFRALAATTEDIDAAVRAANPALFAQRAQLEARVANLENTIRQAAGRVKVGEDSNAARLLVEQEAKIAEWKAMLERGEFPKKRQRELVQKDIADMEKANVQLRAKALAGLPGGGKNVATRLSKLAQAIGHVDQEIAFQKAALQESQAAAAANVPKITVAARLEELVDAHERALPTMGEKYDAMANEAADAAITKIDMGDLKDVDLDLDILDAETGKTRSLRDMMAELTKDNNLEKAMKECNI